VRISDQGARIVDLVRSLANTQCYTIPGTLLGGLRPAHSDAQQRLFRLSRAVI
jgi:hypothetical protein